MDDGWMSRWVEGWVDGWMDGCMGHRDPIWHRAHCVHSAATLLTDIFSQVTVPAPAVAVPPNERRSSVGIEPHSTAASYRHWSVSLSAHTTLTPLCVKS